MKHPLAWALRLGVAIGVLTPATGAISFSVSFDDPTAGYTSYYSSIQSNLLAAAQLWGRQLGGNATLELQIRIDPNTTRAGGRSAASSFLTTLGGINVFEQGMAAELRTGIDPNGIAPDGEIFLQPSYLTDELWFDPTPTSRSAAVPASRTDAVSVFLHELGHAFAFIGWKDGSNGTLPGDYESTFDRYTSFDGANLYFNGPVSVSLHGSPIPLTYGTNFHFGNTAPRPGADLLSDLMNGIVFERGSRYHISPLDLAVMQDSGLVVVPEVGSVTCAAVGCLLLAVRRRGKAARRLHTREAPGLRPKSYGAHKPPRSLPSPLDSLSC